VEEAIESRRSVRDFKPETLTRDDTAQLLWSAQGLTGDAGLRAAPSAGALYPLELYLATEEGLDRYVPEKHELERVVSADLRPPIRKASLDQACITSAPAVFIFTAVYDRTCGEYGSRGRMYVHIDLGHAAQNLLLQAEVLGLAGVPVAAFDPDELRPILALPEGEVPVYLVPIGRPL
jgi:SagB-type dehydrogenase family enzyme